ncbi:MAG: hypothetical protein GQ577_12255, partial [Woeseiaceae bacterium]|nr:hypothetical protein [Woeseiaceae bacterium]
MSGQTTTFKLWLSPKPLGILCQVNNHPVHGRNLRNGRYSESGRIYFVTSSCYRRKRLFGSAQRAKVLMDEFVRLGSEKICENLAFVVMPDHFHWLVQLADETSLSE